MENLHCIAGALLKTIAYKNLPFFVISDTIGSLFCNTICMNKNKLSYTQASRWAQQQNILTKEEWHERYLDGAPKDIPANPEDYYADKFTNWHDFLDTQLSRDGRKIFWSSKRAQQWAKTQGITTQTKWREMVRLGLMPIGVPAQPLKVYSAIYTSWSSFLGTGRLPNNKKPFVPYEKSVQWAKDNNITSQSQWKEKVKKNSDLNLPLNPNRVYKERFTNWGDFLGTGRIANKDREFISYEEALTWASEQGIFSIEEWYQRTKKDFPKNIPVAPYQVYGKQFKWSEFLGYKNRMYQGKKKHCNLISYEEALIWAREKGICSSLEWIEKCKEEGNERIPSQPFKVYAEFKNWNDFLGLKQTHGMSKIERMIRYVVEMIFEDKHSEFGQATIIDNHNKKHRVDICLPKYNLIVEYDGSYWHQQKERKDRNKTKSLKESPQKWNVIRMRGKPLALLDTDWDINIDESTSAVTQIYDLLQHILVLHNKNLFPLQNTIFEEIQSWTIEKLNTIKFREVLEKLDHYKSYEEAVKTAQKYNIKKREEWEKYVENNPDCGFPNSLIYTYQNEFKGWGDFLGTGRCVRKVTDIVSYKKASEWAQSQNIKSAPQWWRLSKDGKIPSYIPAAPSAYYKKEFKDNNGWYGFLGKSPPKTKLKQ